MCWYIVVKLQLLEFSILHIIIHKDTCLTDWLGLSYKLKKISADGFFVIKLWKEFEKLTCKEQNNGFTSFSNFETRNKKWSRA